MRDLIALRGSRTTLRFARATFDQNRFVTLSRVSIAGGLHGESEDLPLFKTTYAVGAGEVLLTVVIGEKQLGTSLARMGDKALAKGAIKKLKVGKGPGLAGSKLTMKSVVTDSNDMTNRTSITIMLEGGTAPAKHTLAIEVDEQGDSAIYRSEVEFVP